MRGMTKCFRKSVSNLVIVLEPFASVGVLDEIVVMSTVRVVAFVNHHRKQLVHSELYTIE